jgi:hypothetical protein
MPADKWVDVNGIRVFASFCTRNVLLSLYSSEVAEMSKSKFTEADVRRAVKGVFDGGGRVSSVEIWPDGRISVRVKEDKQHRSMDPEDDPEVSRRLL